MKRKVPPILQIPGLVVHEMGTNEEGTYITFIVNNPDQTVREVTILMQSNQPVRWTYQYSIYEATTGTVVTYKGRFGDPGRDKRIDLRGV